MSTFPHAHSHTHIYIYIHEISPDAVYHIPIKRATVVGHAAVIVNLVIFKGGVNAAQQNTHVRCGMDVVVADSDVLSLCITDRVVPNVDPCTPHGNVSSKVIYMVIYNKMANRRGGAADNGATLAEGMHVIATNNVTFPSPDLNCIGNVGYIASFYLQREEWC